MEHVPRNARWIVGSALPWSEEEAEGAMRTRLRIAASPQPPNAYGFVGIALTLIVLPTAPAGEEIPIARTAAVLNLN